MSSDLLYAEQQFLKERRRAEAALAALARIADLHSGEMGDPDTYEQAAAALKGLDPPWLNRFEDENERLRKARLGLAQLVVDPEMRSEALMVAGAIVASAKSPVPKERLGGNGD